MAGYSAGQTWLSQQNVTSGKLIIITFAIIMKVSQPVALGTVSHLKALYRLSTLSIETSVLCLGRINMALCFYTVAS